MSLIGSLRGSSRLGLLVTVSAVTVGVIYGYDSSNIAGALLFIARDFHLSDAQQGDVAASAVVGQIVGALAAGPLANRIGRKYSMVSVALTFVVFSVLGALAWSVPALLVARALLGVTIGVSLVVAPVYLAESSAAAVRGAVLVLYQVATVIGIILAYLVAYGLAASGSWRWILGVAAVPAALVTVLLLRLPDTARWYVMQGRNVAARQVLTRVDPEADVDAELADIRRALGEERGGALREMVRKPYLRATGFVLGLGFFVQITGINAIVYYNPRIFEAMGFRGNFSLLVLPALVQVGGLIAVLVSVVLIDRVGRRPVLLTGIGIMVVANALLVGVFARAGRAGAASGTLGFVGVVLFIIGFTFGFGALVWVYAGESFPARLRSYGASAMLTADLVANTAVARAFPVLLKGMGGAGVFALFGVLSLAAFGFVVLFAPETKGRRLEDIRHFWEHGGHWPGDERVGG